MKPQQKPAERLATIKNMYKNNTQMELYLKNMYDKYGQNFTGFAPSGEVVYAQNIRTTPGILFNGGSTTKTVDASITGNDLAAWSISWLTTSTANLRFKVVDMTPNTSGFVMFGIINSASALAGGGPQPWNPTIGRSGDAQAYFGTNSNFLTFDDTWNSTGGALVSQPVLGAELILTPFTEFVITVSETSASVYKEHSDTEFIWAAHNSVAWPLPYKNLQIWISNGASVTLELLY